MEFLRIFERLFQRFHTFGLQRLSLNHHLVPCALQTNHSLHFRGFDLTNSVVDIPVLEKHAFLYDAGKREAKVRFVMRKEHLNVVQEIHCVWREKLSQRFSDDPPEIPPLGVLYAQSFKSLYGFRHQSVARIRNRLHDAEMRALLESLRSVAKHS